MSEEQNVDLTFREAITELGQIVEALESNKLELEESLVKIRARNCAYPLFAWSPGKRPAAR